MLSKEPGLAQPTVVVLSADGVLRFRWSATAAPQALRLAVIGFEPIPVLVHPPSDQRASWHAEVLLPTHLRTVRIQECVIEEQSISDATIATELYRGTADEGHSWAPLYRLSIVSGRRRLLESAAYFPGGFVVYYALIQHWTGAIHLFGQPRHLLMLGVGLQLGLTIWRRTAATSARWRPRSALIGSLVTILVLAVVFLTMLSLEPVVSFVHKIPGIALAPAPALNYGLPSDLRLLQRKFARTHTALVPEQAVHHCESLTGIPIASTTISFITCENRWIVAAPALQQALGMTNPNSDRPECLDAAGRECDRGEPDPTPFGEQHSRHVDLAAEPPTPNVPATTITPLAEGVLYLDETSSRVLSTAELNNVFSVRVQVISPQTLEAVRTLNPEPSQHREASTDAPIGRQPTIIWTLISQAPAHDQSKFSFRSLAVGGDPRFEFQFVGGARHTANCHFDVDPDARDASAEITIIAATNAPVVVTCQATRPSEDPH